MRSALRMFMGCALLLVATASWAWAETGGFKANRVGAEILGRGLALTLNYERYVTANFGAGAGLMYIKVDDGSVAVVPVYASYITGGMHNLYASAGATFLGGGGSIQDYEGTTLLTAALGYEYQSPGGFFVRPLFTVLVPTEGDEDSIVWPGIMLGGSF